MTDLILFGDFASAFPLGWDLAEEAINSVIFGCQEVLQAVVVNRFDLLADLEGEVLDDDEPWFQLDVGGVFGGGWHEGTGNYDTVGHGPEYQTEFGDFYYHAFTVLSMGEDIYGTPAEWNCGP